MNPLFCAEKGVFNKCCYLSGQWQRNFHRFCWLDFAIMDSYNGEIHEFSIICHSKNISALAVDPFIIFRAAFSFVFERFFLVLRKILKKILTIFIFVFSVSVRW